MKQIILILSLFFTLLINVNAQDTVVVDRIVARVADEIILKSDIEEQYQQMGRRSFATTQEAKCFILEDLLLQKLLINQAKLDSIIISDEDVAMEVDMRIEFFIQQAKSVAALEEYFNKTIQEIKADLTKTLRNQFIAQRVQMELTKDIKVTPSEVQEFYENMDSDSLPIIDTKYEIQQIIIYPKVSEQRRQRTIDRLEGYKEVILSGGMSFSSHAISYSEDLASSNEGGELGYMGRGELVPEFANAAFELEKDEISDVVETEFGFHLIQMIDRKGERVNVRHILLKPKVSRQEKQTAKTKLDSIKNVIVSDSTDFEQLIKFSEHQDSRNNNGLIYNEMRASTSFGITELPHNIKPYVENLKQDEISKVTETTDDRGHDIYVIYKLKTKKDAHLANLDDDYQIILDMALAKKKQDVFNDWIKESQRSVYIYIDPKYRNCEFNYDGWIHEN